MALYARTVAELIELTPRGSRINWNIGRIALDAINRIIGLDGGAAPCCTGRMITMTETANAVCLTEGCWWTASGPNSVNAAVAHDVEFGDHDIRVMGGIA
jgi:hypothetical protein